MGDHGFTLRTDLLPSDRTLIVHHHLRFYSSRLGFDAGIAEYVADGITEMAEQGDSVRSRVWVAEGEGSFAGCIGIVGRPDKAAQLRWFLVRPEVAGRGLGRRLMGEALAFCRETGNTRVYLWTVRGLDAAAHLYREAGFEMVEEVTHRQWGQMVTEERWELRL